MPEMSFNKPAVKEPQGAPAPETPVATPDEPKMRKIMIRTGENGDNSTCQWPDPKAGWQGGKWLLLPRNEVIEVDERAIDRQKKRHVIARIKNLDTGEEREVKQLIYPIDYLD